MAFTDKTGAQAQAAARAAINLNVHLRDYYDGHPGPGVSLGRYTAAEMDTALAAGVQALLAVAPGSTVVGVALTGNSTAAVSATAQQTLTATKADLTTENVSATATWTSSDPTKATISATGLVTGVAAGTTTITGVYEGFSKSKTFTVTA